MTRVASVASGAVVVALGTLGAVLCFDPARACAGVAQAEERAEIAAQVSVIRQSEFSASDVGIGGRVTFDVNEMLAVEGQLALLPRNLGSPVAFSGHRVEGLFGVTIGARAAGSDVRVFGMVEPGFVRFGPSPQSIACVAIFPPPLTCSLAAGQTELAVAVGGGVTAPVGRRARGRVDVSDLVIRYNESVTSHNLRVTAGAGFRF